MAAFPRPSLRSSNRQCASLDDVPPTDIQQNSGKCTTRKASGNLHNLPNLPNQPVKRQKVYGQEFSHSKAIVRTRLDQGFTAPTRRIAKNPVTQSETAGNPTFVPQIQIPIVSTSVITIASKHSPTVENNVTTSKSVGSIKKIDKRILRSHDGGSRSKSELALYFPNYDELVSIEAKNPDFVTAETRVHIVDESSSTVNSNSASSSLPKISHESRPIGPTISRVNGVSPVFDLSDENFWKFGNAQRIDFSSIERHTSHNDDDLLTDDVYFKAHRRAERQEKQLRNIEKERAQHEKVQLERLLEGLKGHDWLRVMGISGITDSERKAFEPKRDFFVQEVTSLIDKFKMWKEEEKRRKMEREQNLLPEENSESRSQTGASVTSGGGPPDYSDVDAWAARQLHQEAISATDLHPRKNRRSPAQVAPAPSHNEKPFTSFYSKPYLRDAAVGKHRRGRARFAFGQPLPDFAEKPFSLPPDMLSQDILAASARNRRRARREGKET